MNTRITVLGIAVSMLLGQSVLAAGPAVRNQFVSGQKALAAQVNENFQELADRIQTNTTSIATNTSNITNNTTSIDNANANITALTNAVTANTAAIAVLNAPVTYDYHTYSVPKTITSRSFASTNLPSGNVSTWVETITRVPVAGNTNVTVHRVFDVDGHAFDFDYVATPDSYNFVGSRSYAPGSTTADVTFTLASPIPERTSSMQVGKMFGSASEVSVSGSSTTPGVVEVMSTVVGIEPITINVNGNDTTYTDCIKIMMSRFDTVAAYGSSFVAPTQTNW